MTVPVDAQGLVSSETLESMLTGNTRLVSIMSANNETGVLQPINQLARLVKHRVPGATFHTDATQSIGKMQIDLTEAWEDVDLLSFSGHKFGGPKGIGGLFIRDGVSITPILRGGNQESGLRAGTLNTPGLAGLAVAARIARGSPFAECSKHRDEFESNLIRRFPNAIIHSQKHPVFRIPVIFRFRDSMAQIWSRSFLPADTS